MAAAVLSPQQLQEIQVLAAQWGKIVARRAFGDAGPGLEVDLLAMEQIADAAGRGLTEGTLTTMLELQAQVLPPDQPCPGCGQVCPVAHQPRTLVSRAGPLPYREPFAHCPDCRRDFFPPATRLAPGRA